MYDQQAEGAPVHDAGAASFLASRASAVRWLWGCPNAVQ